MQTLSSLIAAELAQPVDAKVSAMAAALATKYPDAARAVLFYGSCLREAQLDGLMLDFYLIVSNYRAAYGDSWMVRANQTIPPNVFPFEHAGLIAKYAVLSEADFAKLNRIDASSVSVWARFAQPSRLVWSADESAQNNAVSAIASAPATLFELTLPILEPGADHSAPAIWRAGFAQTYRAELRAERTGRAASVVDADVARYTAFGEAVLTERANVAPLSRNAALKRWSSLRRNGKLLTVARLAKAAFTYAGGIDYLAWKINRHAGTQIEIKPWQRKWPLVAALVLVPKLLVKGAVR